MPISLEAVVNALPTKDCFVTDYVQYAYRQGKEAAVVYHLGVALSLLSATVPITMGTRYAGPILRPNLYTLLLGPSGDGKSASLMRGRELLQAAAPKRVKGMPGSAEAIFDSVAKQNQQLMMISEWGALLAPAKRGYFEGVKTTLTDFFDANPSSRDKANNKENKDYISHIENPRLSLLAGCSLSYLERHTLAEDWTGGFMGRFLLLYGVSDGLDPWPIPDLRGQPKLIQALRERAEYTAPIGECMGPEPGSLARLRWDEWYRDVNTRILTPKIAGVKKRAPVMALKAAMLYAWDYGKISPEPWYLDLDTLNPGIELAELHLASIIDLSDALAVHEDARLLREIMQAVEQCGGTATVQQILTKTQRRAKLVTELIQTLVQEGSLRLTHDEDGLPAYLKIK